MQLRIIKSDTDHEEAMNALMNQMDADPAVGSIEADELEVLSVLIEQYEEKHFPIDLPDPVEAIRFRMDQQGLTQNNLVPYLGSASRVSEVLRHKRSLSLSMIRAINKGLGIPASVLIQDPNAVLPDAKTVAWDKFPLKEMYERNCFPGFKNSLKDLKEYAEELVGDFKKQIPNLVGATSPAYLRSTVHQRCGKNMNEYALDIWQNLVLKQTALDPLPTTFIEGSVNEVFMRRIVHESWSARGPLLAKELLNQHGIYLIIEPHFNKTYLDGAALQNASGNPIVALTLRHDRLDNFWFTLMHELAHIALHFDGENTVFIDDLESDGASDILETEADTLATHVLIDNDIWESKRPTTKETILGLSHKLGIHSAIIAGRIRYEDKNYHRYSNLIGRGLVRKLFDSEKS